MTNYRRARAEGSTWFFTVTLASRQSGLLASNGALLRDCFRKVRQRHPFTIDAAVILPDHLHCIWTLPENDADYSTRWYLIKSAFSREVANGEFRSRSRTLRGERGIWQRRFWEHLIRDEDDLRNHIDYIHSNPVKHGHAGRATDWPQSSIHKFVRQGLCDSDWAAEPAVLDMEAE